LNNDFSFSRSVARSFTDSIEYLRASSRNGAGSAFWDFKSGSFS
jgi:hypothetical protein